MSSALLVIDMQNGFIHPDGSLPRLGMGIPDVDSVIAANAQAIAAARAARIPVIYTRSVFRPGMVDLPMRMEGFLPPNFELLERGSWDADVHADLTPAEGEAVIDKNRYDAFLNTPLEQVLRTLGATNVLVTGTVTSICVESTVRSGYMRDFDMYVASDCVAGAPGQHEASLAIMGAAFATVLPWREAMSRITGEGVLAAAGASAAD
ncbi:cysteine hydrolase family protein [Clavibacter californiensis]|uniref:Cysteine hydrolase n=1 Tax=Clavibacter californiensis TaxID=1401995 RepID=A0ABX9NBV8_9MICO|nr:isochorismatase family cysteine hydrolase [Clavibacter californiensis]RII94389.1 cysteine hydrolase [Clavibacter californiensis]UKF80895.1 cysteine hydrolase [Clavibacter californiensis]